MDSGKLIRAEDAGNGKPNLDFPPPLLPAGYFPATLPQPALLDYWHILVKRKAVVLITLAVVFALVAFRTYRTTSLYESTGRLAIYHDTQTLPASKAHIPVTDDDRPYH